MGTRSVSIVLAVLLLSVAGTAQAQKKEQRFVFGFGLGSHRYSETDQYRLANLPKPDGSAPALDWFFEWYPLTRLGLGIRELYTIEAHSIPQPAGITDHIAVATGTSVLSLNLIPWISDSGYSRIGVVLGFGSATYAAAFSQEGPDGYTTYSDSWGTSGSAQWHQLYLDWGGDVFGARLVLGWLRTDLDPLTVTDQISNTVTNYDVDPSGRQYLLEFRWAIP